VGHNVRGQEHIYKDPQSALTRYKQGVKQMPKQDGKLRPLGIPAIIYRVVQMATKLMIEPIFETDFKEFSYGFCPKRDVKGTIRHNRRAVKKDICGAKN
jgi:retron-type reverse transcriptase